MTPFDTVEQLPTINQSQFLYSKRYNPPLVKLAKSSLHPLSVITIIIVICMMCTFIQSAPLFNAGTSDWQIVITEHEPTVHYAAEELQQAIKKISGTTIPIIKNMPENSSRSHFIILGTLSSPYVKKHAPALNLTSGRIEQLAVKIVNNNLYLCGNNPRGALYAVYTFLKENLGVRWLWPGKSGEFMPPRMSFTLPNSLSIHYVPSISYRGFHLCGAMHNAAEFKQWMTRNYINIKRHISSSDDRRKGLYSMWSSHNIRLPKKLMATHPDYFTERNGKRYKDNICFSNPDVDKLVLKRMKRYINRYKGLEILSIFPVDNQSYCRCPQCSTRDVSTCWFDFYNRLTNGLKKEFPNLDYATIAYQGYLPVPANPVRNSLFVEYASHNRCYNHTLNNKKCKRNIHVMTQMKQWQQTPVDMGHYGYEFDIFSRNRMFLPFLTIIKDAIKTYDQLGQQAIITEIPLHTPKNSSTPTFINKNRLPIYLYARLLWNPHASISNILNDWCRTAYGPAAVKMQTYFMLLDSAWNSQKKHQGISGNALYMVQDFLNSNTAGQASKLLTEAKTIVLKTVESESKDRISKNINDDAAHFQKWLLLKQLARTDLPYINAPFLTSKDKFPASSYPATNFAPKTSPKTEARFAWTKDAILINWNCQAKSTPTLTTSTPAMREDNMPHGDQIELSLCNSRNGETYTFGVNKNGNYYDSRLSNVGIHEKQWNPAWTVSVKPAKEGWQVRMSIPFKSLGTTPLKNNNWQVSLKRYSHQEGYQMVSCFPGKNKSALLIFSARPCTDRRILYWSGCPKREQKRYASLRKSFIKQGWDINIAENMEQLEAIHDKCDAFWFRHPDGTLKLTNSYCQNKLQQAVKNGKIAIFHSYMDIPLDQYFNDPSLKLKRKTVKGLPLAGRKTKIITPGPWSTKPNNINYYFQRGYAPAYGFEPEKTDGWQIFARTPQNSTGELMTYFMIKPYGKGLIVVMGANFPLPAGLLPDNMIELNRQIQAAK